MWALSETSAKALRTQLELDTQKVFLGYNNQGADPADVTFNLKDFKAMLSLCEALQSNVELRFEAPGNPLVVRPHVNSARLGGQVGHAAAGLHPKAPGAVHLMQKTLLHARPFDNSIRECVQGDHCPQPVCCSILHDRLVFKFSLSACNHDFAKFAANHLHVARRLCNLGLLATWHCRIWT